MSQNHQEKGFTLIELLITVIIIGVLAAALIPKVQSIKDRARDTQRIEDIKQIAHAIFVYYTDNNKYPDKGNTGDGNRAVSTKPNFIPDLTPKYMTLIPKDPTNVDATGAFWDLKSSATKDIYYVYYAYPAASAWTNTGCSFSGSEFSVVGAVTMEAGVKNYMKVTAGCSGGHSRNDEIDYPYAIQSRGAFYTN